MNKVLVSMIFGSFLLTGSTFAQTPPPAPAPAAPVAVPVAVHHEHHPEMHKAMRKLRGAKADLEKASHDYAGHRVAAIKLIDQAIEEIKAGLASEEAKS
jgi:hypothetical protein